MKKYLFIACLICFLGSGVACAMQSQGKGTENDESNVTLNTQPPCMGGENQFAHDQSSTPGHSSHSNNGKEHYGTCPYFFNSDIPF